MANRTGTPVNDRQRRWNSAQRQKPPKQLAAEALEHYREHGPNGLSTHQLTAARDLAGPGTSEGARISRILARRGA